MDLNCIEQELKKRLVFPYKWGRKQQDTWDMQTNFIYNTPTFEELLSKVSSFPQDLKDYAMNRWYNFWSAVAVESIFCNNEMVSPNPERKDKLFDFKIGEIPFDHKTSVFPKGFNKSLKYAKENKTELVRWLYTYQSQEGRKHHKNRLFIVLFSQDGLHWKLKSDLSFIEEKINEYLSQFNPDNLIEVEFPEGKVLSDIIFIEK